MWWKILAPFRLLYKIYFALIFVIVSLVMYPGALILIQRKEWRNALFFYKKNIWVPLICILSFIFKKVNYPPGFHFPKGAYVVCCNHTSYLDIVLLYTIIPGQYVFLAKEEVRKIPFVSLFFRKGVHETVQRGNKSDGSRALEKMREKTDAGLPVILFPEGGTTKHPPRMKKELKPGPFKLAIEKQIPVLPITFVNNWQILSSPSKPFGHSRPGISKIVFHPTIDTKGMAEKDLLSLQQRVHDIIEAPIKKRYPEYFHENK